MRHLTATLRLDVLLQAHNKLYTIGLAVAVLLGLLVRFLVPESHIGRGLTGFLILGLGGTTYMFGASMLLLERDAGTLLALRTSTMTIRDYVLSKVLTLTAFSMIESLIVILLSARGVEARWWLVALGTAVLGAFYTLLGVGLATGYKAVTTFLLPAGTIVAMICQLPFFSLLGLGPDWLWLLIPTQAPLWLLLGAFEPLATWQWIYASIMSALMLGGAWRFCAHRFHTKLGFRET